MGDSDSAKYALKRAEKNIKDSAKDGDSAIDGTVNFALSIARDPLVVGAKTIDGSLHTGGTIFRETSRSSKKIGVVLKVASQPENIGKIALIYGASVVAGPMGSAFANVMYDKLILKKSMTEREMLNSFAIGAAAGYAAEGMQGAVEGPRVVDSNQYANYLAKSASAVTRNLTADAGNIILNNESYSSKDFFKSLATGVSSLEFGNDFTSNVVESAVESGLDSVAIQAIDTHLSKVDLTLVTDAMISGFANGITREAVHSMLDATLLKALPDNYKRIDQKSFDAFSEMFYQAIVTIQQSNYLLEQQTIMDRFAALDSETQSRILNSLKIRNQSLKVMAAIQAFHKPFPQLSADELKSEKFLKAYYEKINVCNDCMNQYPEFAELTKPILAERDPAGAAAVLTDIVNTTEKVGLTLLDGGAATEIAVNLPKVFKPIPIISVFLALFETESAGSGSDVVIGGSFKVPLPIDPTNERAMELYHLAKSGDRSAYFDYLNYERDEAQSGASRLDDGKTSDEQLGRLIGVLREAKQTKGMFGIGNATRSEAANLGLAWVGPNYKIASDGKTLISADGLKQYRPPSYKEGLNKTQANFEWREPNVTKFKNNGHLDIVD